MCALHNRSTGTGHMHCCSMSWAHWECHSLDRNLTCGVRNNREVDGNLQIGINGFAFDILATMKYEAMPSCSTMCLHSHESGAPCSHNVPRHHSATYCGSPPANALELSRFVGICKLLKTCKWLTCKDCGGALCQKRGHAYRVTR